MKLRRGVRFHDGTPFEAEDIAYTFARVPTVPNSPALFTPAVREYARRGGNVALLRELGAAHGMAAEAIAPVMLDGEPVSSSRIRR